MRILGNKLVTLHVIDFKNNVNALLWKIFRQNLILKSNLIRIKSTLLLMYQTAKKILTQGLIPLVHLLENLLKDKKPENFKLARDSFHMLAYAHRDLSNLRRQRLNMVVAEKYRQLMMLWLHNLNRNSSWRWLWKTDKNIKWDEEIGKDLTKRPE